MSGQRAEFVPHSAALLCSSESITTETRAGSPRDTIQLSGDPGHKVRPFGGPGHGNVGEALM